MPTSLIEELLRSSMAGYNFFEIQLCYFLCSLLVMQLDVVRYACCSSSTSNELAPMALKYHLSYFQMQ